MIQIEQTAAVRPSNSTPSDTGGGAYAAALRRMRPTLLSVLAISAVINVLMLTGSIYMLQIYDRVLSSGSVPTLVGLFAIVVVLYGFLGFYDFLRARILSRNALRLDAALGTEGFRRWLQAGLPGAAGRHDAQTLKDLDTLRTVLGSPAVTALADLPFVPLFLGVLFLIHPWLGLLTVAGAVVGAAIALINRALTQGAIRRTAGLDATARDFADHSRRAAEAVTAMGMQHAVTQRWRGLQQAMLATAQNGSDPSEVLAATSRAFRMLLQSAILTLGAWLVLRGEITAGMIIASSILSGRALAPVDQVTGQWRNLGQALAAHQRLHEGFAADPAAPARIDLPAPTGAIAVSGLTRLGPVRAGADRVRILNDVSFRLEAGEGLGVVGNSASGKSTLARLLVGAAEADGGEIRLDGATLAQWDPRKLGPSIGYLPQSLELLPGTIRDNICRFDAAATDEAVIAAAELAGVHQMILALPQGYATRIGEAGRGQHLSGGQIQRLGLARALFGMPRLVVLDEPNSNLDAAGDDALIRAIRTLRAAGSTVIVMAHRPSALAAVDKLLLLDGGEVRAFGPKDEILAGAIRIDRAPVIPARIVAEPEPAPEADAGMADQADPETAPEAAPPALPAPAAAAAAMVTPLRRIGTNPVRTAGPQHRRRQA